MPMYGADCSTLTFLVWEWTRSMGVLSVLVFKEITDTWLLKQLQVPFCLPKFRWLPKIKTMNNPLSFAISGKLVSFPGKISHHISHNSMFTLKKSVRKILEKLPIQEQSQFSTWAERDVRPDYGIQRGSAWN